jgi:polyferredoxin
MLKEFRQRRTRLQAATFAGLPLVVIGGWFFPKLGFLLLGCMIGAMAIALFRGRAWCDWMCPRGSFYDLFLTRLSRKRRIPAFFRAPGTRIAVLALLFTALGAQISFAWPEVDSVGKAFVVVLTITTSAGILLGIGIHPRTWCHICPMGTFANWISGGKHPLMLESSCVSCKVCEKVCPMQLAPYEDREQEVFGNNDCIKCGACVAACPKKILSFDRELKKAA